MATRFWVGGSGTWDASDTTHWSATTGGAGGASVPTTSDSVDFNTLSNATGYTVTISAGACAALTAAAPLAGNLTWSGSGALQVNGALTLYASLVNNWTGTLTFGGATSANVNLAGIVLGGPVIVNKTSSGTITQTAAFSCGSNAWTSTTGNWTTGNYAFTCGTMTLGAGSTPVYTMGSSVVTVDSMVWGSATKQLLMGSSTWTVATSFTGGGTGFTLTMGSSVVNCATWSMTSGVIFDAGTSTVKITSTAFTPGSLTYSTVWFNVAAGITIPSLSGATIANLKITGSAASMLVLLAADISISGTFTCTGADAGSGRFILASSVRGTPRTITAATTALTNVDFLGITAAGAGAWTGTAFGDLGENTGCTFTTPVTRYWVATSGGNWNATSSWSASSGGASGASIPLPQDTANINVNSITSGSRTITVDGMALSIVNCTGVLNSPTLDLNPAANAIVYAPGSITLAAGMLWTSRTVALTFTGSVATTLTTAAVVVGNSITCAKVGGTLTHGDACTMVASSTNGNLIHTDGTWDFNDFAIRFWSFTSTSGRTRAYLLGTGTSGPLDTATGSIWTVTSTGLTGSAETSTIDISNSTSSAQTFAGGGLTYYNMVVDGVGTGTLSVTGSDTFNNFSYSAAGALTLSGTNVYNSLVVTGAPKTVNFGTGTTHTIAVAPTWLGTSPTALISLLGAGPTIISIPAGRVVLDYLNLEGVNFVATSGTLEFYAGLHSAFGGAFPYTYPNNR